MAVSLQGILVPKKKGNPAGVSSTSTFNPTQTNTVLGLPGFQKHLEDIFTNRTSLDSRALLTDLFRHDSDVSATVNAYLTMADTDPHFYAYDQNHQLDPQATKDVYTMLQNLFGRIDYTTGFEFTHSIYAVAEQMRYSILLTGAITAELVFDKFLLPDRVNNVNPNEIFWYEKAPGIFKPEQRPTKNAGNHINLDIANFFVKFYRQNPFEIYAQSNFVSCINTIAARQQVINDLYRIMQKVGYPRMEASVVEEVLRKNAPLDIRRNEAELQKWVNSRMADIARTLTNLGPEAAYVHTDAVEVKMLNEGGPGKAFDVKEIIDVLNNQNQAALKTMATVIGRGEAGVNTGSVEARIFSLAAQSLNRPIQDCLSDMTTLAMRMTGYQGYIVCRFDDVEMRPSTELEPQLVTRATRMLTDLSLGIIEDAEYTIEMYGRMPNDGAPPLSGTNFQQAAQQAKVDTGAISPNADPLGRSVASPGAQKGARSNK